MNFFGIHLHPKIYLKLLGEIWTTKKYSKLRNHIEIINLSELSWIKRTYQDYVPDETEKFFRKLKSKLRSWEHDSPTLHRLHAPALLSLNSSSSMIELKWVEPMKFFDRKIIQFTYNFKQTKSVYRFIWINFFCN